MTKEDMIRMAHESGWQYAHGDSGYEPLWAFAELVASAEREACAKVCETFDQREAFNDEDMAVAEACADAIRARSKE